MEIATITACHESTHSLNEQWGSQSNLTHMAACSDLFR